MTDDKTSEIALRFNKFFNIKIDFIKIRQIFKINKIKFFRK